MIINVHRYYKVQIILDRFLYKKIKINQPDGLHKKTTYNLIEIGVRENFHSVIRPLIDVQFQKKLTRKQ